MPVVDLDTAGLVELRTLSGIRHIGSDVAPLPAGTTCDRSGRLNQFGQPAPVPNARWCESPLPVHSLPTVAQHGAVAVSHGRIRDGVGRAQVVAWLRENAVAAQEWIPGLLPGLPVHDEPLTVHIYDGTTDKQAGYVVDAVRIINAALPREWELTISEERTPELAVADIPAGEAHVGFNRTPDTGRFNLTIKDGEFTGGRLLIHSDLDPYAAASTLPTATDLDYQQTNVGFLVHELMHAMEFLAHPDMASALSYSRELTGVVGLPALVIYPLDREGLLAAYTRLSYGVAPEDIAAELGPWEDTSTHVRGVLGLPGGDEMAFGAAHRNGFAQGWAYGSIPDTDLAGNAALSGSAQWDGRLLGLTPTARTVAGEAALTVQLGTLDGTLDFSNLEAWSAGAAPGAIGSGTVWRDGDLAYRISVNGNTFVQTGGDNGIVTDGFFGGAHEGMGGTLERDDLAAGFGGTR